MLTSCRDQTTRETYGYSPTPGNESSRRQCAPPSSEPRWILLVLAVPVFRRRLPAHERPYRAWGHPATSALFLCLAGGSILRSCDRYLLSLKYRIAGASPADPSIVIVALDGEEIAKLGGLPLRRSDWYTSR